MKITKSSHVWHSKLPKKIILGNIVKKENNSMVFSKLENIPVSNKEYIFSHNNKAKFITNCSFFCKRSFSVSMYTQFQRCYSTQTTASVIRLDSLLDKILLEDNVLNKINNEFYPLFVSIFSKIKQHPDLLVYISNFKTDDNRVSLNKYIIFLLEIINENKTLLKNLSSSKLFLETPPINESFFESPASNEILFEALLDNSIKLEKKSQIDGLFGILFDLLVIYSQLANNNISYKRQNNLLKIAISYLLNENVLCLHRATKSLILFLNNDAKKRIKNLFNSVNNNVNNIVKNIPSNRKFQINQSTVSFLNKLENFSNSSNYQSFYLEILFKIANNTYSTLSLCNFIIKTGVEKTHTEYSKPFLNTLLDYAILNIKCNPIQFNLALDLIYFTTNKYNLAFTDTQIDAFNDGLLNGINENLLHDSIVVKISTIEKAINLNWSFILKREIKGKFNPEKDQCLRKFYLIFHLFVELNFKFKNLQTIYRCWRNIFGSKIESKNGNNIYKFNLNLLPDFIVACLIDVFSTSNQYKFEAYNIIKSLNKSSLYKENVLCATFKYCAFSKDLILAETLFTKVNTLSNRVLQGLLMMSIAFNHFNFMKMITSKIKSSGSTLGDTNLAYIIYISLVGKSLNGYNFASEINLLSKFPQDASLKSWIILLKYSSLAKNDKVSSLAWEILCQCHANEAGFKGDIALCLLNGVIANKGVEHAYNFWTKIHNSSLQRKDHLNMSKIYFSEILPDHIISEGFRQIIDSAVTLPSKSIIRNSYNNLKEFGIPDEDIKTEYNFNIGRMKENKSTDMPTNLPINVDSSSGL